MLLATQLHARPALQSTVTDREARIGIERSSGWGGVHICGVRLMRDGVPTQLSAGRTAVEKRRLLAYSAEPPMTHGNEACAVWDLTHAALWKLRPSDESPGWGDSVRRDVNGQRLSLEVRYANVDPRDVCIAALRPLVVRTARLPVVIE